MAVIDNKKNSKFIYGTVYNDFITNSGKQVTISGDYGNDYITNTGGSNVSISGGIGNDTIGLAVGRLDNSYGKNVTVNGGAGNDEIYSASSRKHLYEYNIGDGNDIINGFNSNDVLQLNAYSYDTLVSGDDFIVVVGSNFIVLKNSANISVNIKNAYGNLKTYNSNPANVLIGTNYADAITNTNKNVGVLGYAGNDVIFNYADNVSISGDDGNDFINNMGDNVIIYGGNGNDSIQNVGDKGLLIGAVGNDTIYVQGKNNTIDGGQGNDKIILETGSSKNLVAYANNGGNDTVIGLTANDTIELTSGYISKVSVSGSNVIVAVGNNSITGNNLKGKKINIKDWSDGSYFVIVNAANSITQIATNNTTSNMTLNPLVKNFDASTRTTAIKITGNALANSIKGGSGKDTIYGGAGNDKMFGNARNDSLSGGDGKDTLSGGSGNDKLLGGSGNDCIKGGTGNDLLWGGTGNDSLWGDAGNDKLYGGEGKDIFIYKPGEGTDTIFDYQSGDMLKILKSDGKAGGTFTSSSFKNNKLTLAIDGGGKVIFDGVSKSDQININGTIHTISGTKLK